MSAGKLALVCKATGEKLPLDQLRRHGYEFIIVRVTTVKPYFLPFKAGTEPPQGPHVSARPEDVDAFFDEINRRVIADCNQHHLPPLIRNESATDSTPAQASAENLIFNHAEAQ